MPEQLHWFPIDSGMAWALDGETSGGGPPELEVGGLCTTKEAAASLLAKIHKAPVHGRTMTLWLTEAEAMCLAVAASNCATSSLPWAQQVRLDQWHAKWMQSPYANPVKEVANV